MLGPLIILHPAIPPCHGNASTTICTAAANVLLAADQDVSAQHAILLVQALTCCSCKIIAVAKAVPMLANPTNTE
jgi:hypothetical protein